MSAALTRDEYRDIAAALRLPASAFVDEFASASRRETFETFHRAINKKLFSRPACGESVMEDADTKMRQDFRSRFGGRASGALGPRYHTRIGMPWNDHAGRELDRGGG